MISGIFVLSILLLAGGVFASGFTFDGGVDPRVFATWWMVYPPTPFDAGGVHICLVANLTGQNSHIVVAVVYLIQTEAGVEILAYEFQDQSSESVRYFEFNPSTNNYDEVLGFGNGTFKERFDNKLDLLRSKEAYVLYTYFTN